MGEILAQYWFANTGEILVILAYWYPNIRQILFRQYWILILGKYGANIVPATLDPILGKYLFMLARQYWVSQRIWLPEYQHNFSAISANATVY